MLVPSMGEWVYKVNMFLFGEFGYYYPFFLLVLNYIAYKKSYKIENFKRRELFGFSLAFFALLLLFSALYKNSGYILSFVYEIFSTLLGHTGSGIFALLLLFFSLILLFPKFAKEILKIELDFTLLLKVEQGFKSLLMRVFGGENDGFKNSQADEKTKTSSLEQIVKESNINASKNSITTAKENFEKLKNQILDETLEIDKQSLKESRSFVYEHSQQVWNFAQKASKSSVSLDEEFNFITEEEVDMIPERFLKPKKPQDLKQIDTNKNLDEPSYKRKNIEIPLSKQEVKPKIFTKELALRENFIKKEKLEQEYKAYQNEILENKVKQEIKELEEYDAIDSNPIIKGDKYTFNQENTQNLKIENPKSEEKKISDKANDMFDFAPIVEELTHPYIEPTPIKNINEIVPENELSPVQNLDFEKEPVANQVEENKEEQTNEQKQISQASNKPIDEQVSEQEIKLQKAVLAKEIAINQALLHEIEQGELELPKDFSLPALDFLANPKEHRQEINESEIDKKIYNLLEKLRRFKIGGDVISTYVGPVVTTFEFRPSADVKVSRILNLQDDLTMALMAKSIRIQAPIPGKDVVGIEVPNDEIQTIYLREILQSEIFKNAKSPLTIALGKDIVGNAFVTDLKKLPHLLIAGTTGSGKSVGINSMLLSLLYRNSPKTLRLMMIDPKMLEFSIYNDIPHLLTPVITDPKKAVNALSNMVAEMERRYRLMAEAKTKNIENYNEKMKELGKEELPFIVVIIDELADLMMTAGKDVEFYIGRLAQMARASGIHLIVATQRPSVDVVTGLIKANLPSRISYKVGQKIDSKVILDAMGAESLLGRGDCLFTPPGTSSIVRLHAPFASEFEIEKIVDFLKDQQSVEYDESFLKDQQSVGVTSNESIDSQRDELYEEAKRVILEDGKTSISYLQRRLKIGYNRSANIIEQLTQNGILSEPDAKGQREIL
ncbi:DNA translocase FtsK [Campylobacter sp. VTCC 70190]|uniref:DNA translocase FtsK n=1 Tax=Campylobacter sp. VTCC 70190 TaxID=3392118 RepID=UPI00398F63FD